MEKFLTNVFKGILYSIMIGIVGIPVSFIFGWPILQGIYVAILAMGCFALVIAIASFVGTPKQRYEFFSGLKFKTDKVERISEEDKKKLGEQGTSPAIIGIVMIIIGFIIEALMH